MEPQTEPRRRRRPQPINDVDTENFSAIQNQYQPPQVPDVNQNVQPVYNSQPVSQSQPCQKKKNKKNNKRKRSLVLLFSGMYALVYALYLLTHHVEADSTGLIFQWVFYVFGFIVSMVGFAFNAEILALIAAASFLISIPLYTGSIVVLVPSIILSVSAYVLMHKETERVRQENEHEEEDGNQIKFRQGENSMTVPTYAMPVQQQMPVQSQMGYAPQPIIINVQNSNNSENKNNINTATETQYKRKKKWVAFVLAVTFGMFGIHRFYVGKNITGMLYFFTFGLFGIGWIVDCVLIFVGSFTDKAGHSLQ